MDIEKAVREYRVANPQAQFRDAIKHAQITYSEADLVKQFLTTFSDLEVKQAKFAGDVNRIWPD
jgi:hypothetical protein